MAPVRARAVLERLPLSGDVIGAEIGVFSGLMSQALLSRPDLTLYMVDSWEGDGAAYLDKSDWHASLSQGQQNRYFLAALYNTQAFMERRRVCRLRSIEAASTIPDAALDFVFLDADHSQQGCAADLYAWWPKVKSGGLIGGHDYGHPRFPGVKVAVNDFIEEMGISLALGPDTTWFAIKP